MIRFNLRTRIYLSMLAIMLISFLVTGITAYFNYKGQNEEYHNNRLERKEEAVSRSLEYFLQQQGGYIAPDSIPLVFSDKICELSDIHSMPINFYDLRGRLSISSDPTIFEEKGIPEQIDYTILKQLSTGNNRAVITKDNENKQYLIAYWYFRDEENKPIAINSVAYFDLKEQNREELTSFLWKLSQIYIILIIASSILAYVLSNYITKSLTRVTDRLKSVRLSEKNEPLSWKGDDEIGTLIQEYNRMLEEVERSAEKLARSERESAWREMAKQVAHEIKNPLTPMKLRVQHLEQAWKDKSPEFEEKLHSVSKSLVHQIDALSNIATEFSNFAKMPRANKELVDLRQIAQQAVELFAEHDNIEIHYQEELLPNSPTPIHADSEQILRVFNNLLKNAIQAIPDGKHGQLRVEMSETPGHWKVAIQDNGVGIEEDQKQSIFVPNFTTKSHGTGLGLAMVQSIVLQHGGDVWFDSVPGQGSTFFFTVPKSSVDQPVE